MSGALAPRCGRVVAVRGTVLELEMDGALPPLGAALCCLDGKRGRGPVSAVVQAHASASRVRAIALDSTRGLRCGTAVHGSGEPLTVPVGPALLGRVVDLEGRPLQSSSPSRERSPMPVKTAAPRSSPIA